MNKLNEFFNLQMKNLMITQQILIIQTVKLFHHIILIKSYCMNLKIIIKTVFDEHSNYKHQIKNTSYKIHYFMYQIITS